MPLSLLRQRRHWVFDLDGTLTLPVHDFAWIRHELGVPESADILVYLASLPAAAAAPLYLRLEEIEQELIGRTAPATGAAELVARLAGGGAQLGILTRNSRAIARQTLEHIGLAEHFPGTAILGRDEARPKPDPDGICRLAANWGVPPVELVMVGDYLFDLQAGQAVGALTVHVHGPLPRRWPEWTDLCVHDLAELAGLLA